MTNRVASSYFVKFTMTKINSEVTCLLDDAKLLVCEFSESVDELFQKWWYVGLETSEYEKILSEKRKREYLGVRIAMRAMLGKEIAICYNDQGRPSLADNSWQISVSHSNKWIAVMAHPNRLVGIDIECPTDKIQQLYTRFLSKTEQEELNNGKNIKQLQLAWSAKEALYKIIGKQAVDFKKQLRIFPFEVKTEGQLLAQHLETETLYSLFYIQSSEYTMVYCRA